MNIIEVKNNLVKLCYENDLKLAELIKITDSNKVFIAQVLHLEASRIGKTAIAKIIFNYANGIAAYDGSIPSLKAEIEPVNTDILLKTIDKEKPLNLGKLAQQDDSLIVNIDILRDNPIICAEKYFTTKVLLNNIAMQLQARKSKIIVFDTVGMFKSNRIRLAKDFRLPLNNSTIDYIYEKGFEDATAESKSLIHGIFEELSEYSKSVEYIPFDTFKAVIDAEFKRTQLMPLIILKNKIKQIKDWNIFAEKEEDYKTLKTHIENNKTLVIDISGVKEGLQKECIKYVYQILEGNKEEIFIFVPLNNENSDRLLLQQLKEYETVHTTVICGYDYKYLQELKQCSKNMLMFTPLKQQQDFGGYNIFLNKLAEDEFIAYGKMTKFVPLIAKLHNLSASEIYVPKEEIAETKQPEKNTIEETTANEQLPQADTTENEIIENADTDETKQEEVVNATDNSQDEVSEEVTDEEQQITDIPTANEVEDSATEELPEDKVEEEEEEEKTTSTEEPAAEESVEPANTVTEEESADEITNEPVATESDEDSEIKANLQEALDQVNEIEDEEELSDDDLDMIEQLSKPDEEIEVLNQETAESQAENQTEETVVNDTESAQVPVEEAGKEKEEVIDNTEQQVEENNENINTPDESVESTIPEENVAQEETVEEPANAEETVAPDESVEKKTENETITPEESVNEEINTATIPNTQAGLQTRTNNTPAMPEYSSEIPEEDKINNETYKEGDMVMHEEFGQGVVEKMINYGDKILCSINFTSVGKRLLNPEITEMHKI